MPRYTDPATRKLEQALAALEAAMEAATRIVGDAIDQLRDAVAPPRPRRPRRKKRRR